MLQTARLFMNGRSQAVRLPVNFRFEGKEVFIRQDPVTHDVILSSKPDNWDDFFALVKRAKAQIPDDFMSVRDNEMIEDKDIL